MHIYLHTLSLIQTFAALWLGGLLALDMVAAPARFRARGIDRTAAVELGQDIFHRFGMLEAAFALAMAALAVSSVQPSLITALACTLCAIALVLAPWLRRTLESLWKDLKDKPQADRSGLRIYHRLYVLVDLGKMALLLAVIFAAGA